jgi:hypothetical protein
MSTDFIVQPDELRTVRKHALITRVRTHSKVTNLPKNSRAQRWDAKDFEVNTPIVDVIRNQIPESHKEELYVARRVKRGKKILVMPPAGYGNVWG